jgi:DNA invertase Pin-like site-specific DNA recombinase
MFGMTTRTAIYARTSPDCPLSLEEQIERLRTVAAERGWTIISVFSDRPTTVRKGQDRRPGELALIEAIRSRSTERILLWSIDRIGKSLVELVGFLEVCRRSDVLLWVDEQKLDTATSNGLSLFDLSTMMASHLRQSRRDRILRGQAAARSLSIRFGRPPIAKPKVEKAKQFLAAGKGLRESARLAGISPASVSRIKTSINTKVARI